MSFMKKIWQFYLFLSDQLDYNFTIISEVQMPVRSNRGNMQMIIAVFIASHKDLL